MKQALPYILASVLTAFGLLTLFLTSSVILDLFGIREKEGNYVLFVVWANFLAGLLYLTAAFGFVKAKKWTVVPLGVSVLILILTLIGLFIHIQSGGIYETKTIGAMIFRITVSAVFTLFAYLVFVKNKK